MISRFSDRPFQPLFGCLSTCLLISCIGSSLEAQDSTVISKAALDALVSETSGERALQHFDKIQSDFSGFSPSAGSEQMAEWIAGHNQAWGLTGVKVEKFPSNGRDFFWAFKTEPWWEGIKAEVWLTEPEQGRIASFDVHRSRLARFSRSANLTTELIDIGEGTHPDDYAGESVAGKLVIASGNAGVVHQMAVWGHGAAGVISYRNRDTVEHPDLIESLQIVPREGPGGEPAAFVISLSYSEGMRLVDRLAQGGKLVIRAEVEAVNQSEIPPSYYPQVHAIVQGTQPELPEIWIQAHTNYRNGGGGNNLSGVGVTMDLARSLASLVNRGDLPQPKRSIRFTWGAEHMAVANYFHAYPDRIGDVLAYLALDIVGESQSQSVFRMYRTPHSRPSFLNDIVQEMFEIVAKGNMISVRDGRAGGFASRYRYPVLDPAGSTDPFFHKIEPFWGPSDHEDVLSSNIGLHAVLLNSWPDPYIGTQEDTSAYADATQMKRAAVITGAAAWVLANAGPDDIPVLAQNALEKARTRLASEERRAMDLLFNASRDSAPQALWAALNIMSEACRIESEALASLDVFGKGPMNMAALSTCQSDTMARISSQMNHLAQTRHWAPVIPWQPESTQMARLVPQQTNLVRGPVNIFRHQYGQDWLKEKLEDPDFLSKLRIASRGRYAWYETLNFVDGRLTIGQIRDRLAAEYEFVPVEEIHEYFKMLEQAGIIEFQ